MHKRTLRSRLAIVASAMIMAASALIALSTAARAQCLCNAYIVDVDAAVQCSVTVCIPVNGGEVCRSFAPGTTTVVDQRCGLPNTATIPTLCGRIAPPAIGTCVTVPITNDCCVELCGFPTDIGCYRLHVGRVNTQPCPCP